MDALKIKRKVPRDMTTELAQDDQTEFVHLSHTRASYPTKELLTENLIKRESAQASAEDDKPIKRIYQAISKLIRSDF